MKDNINEWIMVRALLMVIGMYKINTEGGVMDDNRPTNGFWNDSE